MQQPPQSLSAQSPRPAVDAEAGDAVLLSSGSGTPTSSTPSHGAVGAVGLQAAAASLRSHATTGVGHSAVRTPPPGFYSALGSTPSPSHGANGGGGGRASYYGESVRIASSSAPPPPGFRTGPDQKDAGQVAPASDGRPSSLLVDGGSSASGWDAASARRSRASPPSGDQRTRLAFMPQQLNRTDGQEPLEGTGKRTESFKNLAAALGTGLAESMDDSFEERRQREQHEKQQRQAAGGLIRKQPQHHHPSVDLNYARQHRHAANRLIGHHPGGVGTGSGSSSAASDRGAASLPTSSHNSPNPGVMGMPDGGLPGVHGPFGVLLPPRNSLQPLTEDKKGGVGGGSSSLATAAVRGGNGITPSTSDRQRRNITTASGAVIAAYGDVDIVPRREAASSSPLPLRPSPALFGDDSGVGVDDSEASAAVRIRSGQGVRVGVTVMEPSGGGGSSRSQGGSDAGVRNMSSSAGDVGGVNVGGSTVTLSSLQHHQQQQRQQQEHEAPKRENSPFLYGLEPEGGRSSAPPQILHPAVANPTLGSNPGVAGPTAASGAASAADTANANSLSLQKQVSSLQRRAAELSELNKQLEERLSVANATNNCNAPGIAVAADGSGHSHQPEPPQRDRRQAAADTLSVAEAERLAEEELSPFLLGSGDPADNQGNDLLKQRSKPSRALAILFASGLPLPDVKSTCEAFGVLESFRSDFAKDRGVVFVCYYDIRSAQYAALELRPCLMGLLASPRYGGHHGVEGRWQGDGGEAAAGKPKVKVCYCVPLNSSSASDESLIVLSGMPSGTDESNLGPIMSSYGAVRGLSQNSAGSYVVEFHNVQDAKQALVELETTQPWGPEVAVDVGGRGSAERRRGRELLALIGRWKKSSVVLGGPGSAGSSLAAATKTAGAITPETLPTSSRTSTPQPGVPAPQSSLKKAMATSLEKQSPAMVVFSNSSNSSHSPMLSEGQGQGAANLDSAAVAGGAPTANAPPLPPPQQQHGTTQLVVDPTGQYSYVVYPAQQHHHAQHQHQHHPHQQTYLDPLTGQPVHPPPQAQQQVMHGPHGTYVTTLPPPPPPTHQSSRHSAYYPSHPHQPPAQTPHQYHHPHATVIQQTSPYVEVPPQYQAVPTPVSYYAQAVIGSQQNAPMGSGTAQGDRGGDSSLSSAGSGGPIPARSPTRSNPRGGGGGSSSRGSGGNASGSSTGSPNKSSRDSSTAGATNTSNQAPVDDRQLRLNLAAVKAGADTRTSLMVRNIPNKYTQQMLLAEFAEAGHGPDKIDFFYLPIDFKNRCNRGYAFVNFADYKDIVPFHASYYGRHWKVFNSDKICDMTYARIQGKAGMLKRFENSALMEKDEEYKPLVFVSHGPDKGKRIPFPR